MWKPYILDLLQKTNPLGSKDTKNIDLTKQLMVETKTTAIEYSLRKLNKTCFCY